MEPGKYSFGPTFGGMFTWCCYNVHQDVTVETWLIRCFWFELATRDPAIAKGESHHQ
jgi:hypothetical protein